MDAKLAWLLEKYYYRSQESVGCSSSQADLYLTEKELHQLHLDEESLRETLEEKAMDVKARDEKIRQNYLMMMNSFWNLGLIRQADKYSQYAEIVAPLFRAMQSYRVGHFAESYQAFEKSANAFIQEFRNWESAWALEALYAVVYEIRILAERAERELASNGKTPEKLKAAGSFLMKVFGVLAVRKRTKTCWSAICHLPIEEFPVRDKLTYMYYAGRLEVLNENYPAADHKLSYALTHCDPRSKANISIVTLC
uniref:PCI domain-containing protein n=1 Tax=Tanacetum cinerariifolium TaxID=118510 RepID=A0A6L2LK03_TANCI|nr:hypothetical protein [Tanacetum cinerariifolium]